MSEGQYNLNWPWSWLSALRGGRPFQVGEIVHPTVDVGAHTPSVQLYQESFVMAVGTNVIVLPGFGRAASLNPAALPIDAKQGARRWLILSFQSNTATAVPGVRLAYVRAPSSPDPDLFSSTAALVANAQLRMIGNPNDGSVYVPAPNLLRFSILNQAGGEVVIMKGIFLESETADQPLPSMFR